MQKKKTSNFILFFKGNRVLSYILLIFSVFSLTGCTIAGVTDNSSFATYENPEYRENLEDDEFRKNTESISQYFSRGSVFEFETGYFNVKKVDDPEQVKDFKILGFDKNRTKVFYQYHSWLKNGSDKNVKNSNFIKYRIKSYDFSNRKDSTLEGSPLLVTAANELEAVNEQKKKFDEETKRRTQTVYSFDYPFELSNVGVGQERTMSYEDFEVRPIFNFLLQDGVVVRTTESKDSNQDVFTIYSSDDKGIYSRQREMSFKDVIGNVRVPAIYEFVNQNNSDGFSNYIEQFGNNLRDERGTLITNPFLNSYVFNWQNSSKDKKSDVEIRFLRTLTDKEYESYAGKIENLSVGQKIVIDGKNLCKISITDNRGRQSEILVLYDNDWKDYHKAIGLENDSGLRKYQALYNGKALITLSTREKTALKETNGWLVVDNKLVQMETAVRYYANHLDDKISDNDIYSAKRSFYEVVLAEEIKSKLASMEKVEADKWRSEVETKLNKSFDVYISKRLSSDSKSEKDKNLNELKKAMSSEERFIDSVVFVFDRIDNLNAVDILDLAEKEKFFDKYVVPSDVKKVMMNKTLYGSYSEYFKAAKSSIDKGGVFLSDLNCKIGSVSNSPTAEKALFVITVNVPDESEFLGLHSVYNVGVCGQIGEKASFRSFVSKDIKDNLHATSYFLVDNDNVIINFEEMSYKTNDVNNWQNVKAASNGYGVVWINIPTSRSEVLLYEKNGESYRKPFVGKSVFLIVNSKKYFAYQLNGNEPPKKLYEGKNEDVDGFNPEFNNVSVCPDLKGFAFCVFGSKQITERLDTERTDFYMSGLRRYDFGQTVEVLYPHAAVFLLDKMNHANSMIVVGFLDVTTRRADQEDELSSLLSFSSQGKKSYDEIKSGSKMIVNSTSAMLSCLYTDV